MKSTPSIVVAASLLALLSACGGGSSDQGMQTVGPEGLRITADNESAVARVAVAGGLSVSQVQTATDAGGAAAQPTGASARAQSLVAVLHRALAASVGPRRTIASASTPPAAATSDTTQCGVSGSLTTTFDDRDASGALSSGDVLTIVFNQCRDSDSSLLNGQAVVTLTGTPTATRIVASADFQNVVDTEGALTSTIDGTVNVAETDTDTESDTTLTVDGAALSVTLASATYNDVILLASATRVTVNQVFAGDRTSVTLAGVFQAQSVPGGGIALQTLSPLVQLGTDAYPSSGVIQAQGAHSSMTMTVLSATQVQLQLDTNGDGSYESTTSVPWATLLP